MGVQLKISATEQKNSFIVYDCTGNYSPSNKGGYGSPNHKLSDMTDSYLELQSPSETDYKQKITTFDDFPNAEGLGYEIMPYMAGLKEIESGEWKIRITSVFKNKDGSSTTKKGYLSVVFVKAVKCCVDKHTPTLNQNAFKDDKQKLIIELSNLLEDVERLVNCGLNGEANKIIEYLKSHCKCCECS